MKNMKGSIILLMCVWCFTVKAQTKLGISDSVVFYYMSFYDDVPNSGSYIPFSYEFIDQEALDLTDKTNRTKFFIDNGNINSHSKVKLDTVLFSNFIGKDQENIFNLFSQVEHDDYGFTALALLCFIFDFEDTDGYFYNLKSTYDDIVSNEDDENYHDNLNLFLDMVNNDLLKEEKQNLINNLADFLRENGYKID